MNNSWVVVVDDEALSLTNAKKILAEQNIRVSCLPSGKNLLKFIENNAPDLILLDILMPDMDGFETYNALRQYEDTMGRNRIPVIFLTSETDNEAEQRGLKAGAADYIRKPFNKEILLSRIENTIVNNRKIESLTEKAMVDKLTGFLNKANGTAKIAKLCETRTGALVILDLDNFKLVNDLYGHDMGDRLLESFADIIRRNIRSVDVVCRIGGDEFMAFFSNITSEAAVKSLTKRLNEQLVEDAKRLMGEDHDISIGISIGAVMVPMHGRDYDTIFSYADKALYSVKHNGKHSYKLHESIEENVEDNDTHSLDDEIDRIIQIVEERNDIGGGLILGQDAFSVIYRYMSRFQKRYGGNATRLLFVLTCKNQEDQQTLDKAIDMFADILRESLRRSDIILKSRSNHFFLLLPELSEHDVSVVVERVITKWKRTEYGDDFEVSYVTKGM